MRETLQREPVYCQVNDRLRDAIRRGEFAPGTRFLSEREIAERFGISRPTANKALSALVAEGILEFRAGVGSFVRRAPLELDLRHLVSFHEKARQAGKTPRTEVLRFTLDEDGWVDVERLRSADGEPMILERRTLDTGVLGPVKSKDLAQSLYGLISKRGLTIGRCDETIRAVALDASDAALLGVDEGSPALLVVADGYLDDGRLLWRERTLYRGDRYGFRNEVGLSGGPAIGSFTH